MVKLSQFMTSSSYQVQKIKRSPTTDGSGQNSVTQIRLRLQTSQPYPLEAMLSNLVSDHELTLNITRIKRENDTFQQLDLEIRGTILRITHGLDYLKSLDITIKGRPNAEGDAWDC
jgi:L-aspartate semialdehyde sulfurtransferase ferredoxin